MTLDTLLAASFPTGRVSDLLGVAAGLLAVSVGVFAFVPLIIELTLERSRDADRARIRAHRADHGFDVLLVSIALLGGAVGFGMITLFVHWRATYILEIACCAVGVASLLVGTLVLGLTLRAIRRNA